MTADLPRHRVRDHLLTGIDLAATFVFALECSLAGLRADLDLFGIAVLACVGAVGGGVVRDLLLGETPPAAFRDWRYAAAAFFAAGAIIAVGLVMPIGGWTPPSVLMQIEAAGLALAAVAGAQKALDYDLNPASVIILAVVGSCGGGVLRDILIAQVPRVLRVDFYATAAAIGALVMLGLRRSGLRPSLAATLTGLTVFVLRIAAASRGWSLPHLR